VAATRHPCSWKTAAKHTAFSTQVRGKAPRQDTAWSPLAPRSGPPQHRRDMSTSKVKVELPTSAAPGSCHRSQKRGYSRVLLGASILVLLLKLVCEIASRTLSKHLLFPSWASLTISCHNPSAACDKAVPSPAVTSRDGIWPR